MDLSAPRKVISNTLGFSICIFLLSCSPLIEKSPIETQRVTPLPEITESPSNHQTNPPIMHQPTKAPNPIVETPLKLTFPSPVAPPVSHWRPPLYEVPFALSPFDHFYFTRPIAADEINWPLADYRYGALWPGKPEIIHTGIDIDAPRGTPVHATGPGKVIWAGYGLFTGDNNPNDPYGQAVTIEHDFGYQGRKLYTIHAHMDKIVVITGQRVETGDVIGFVGDTGMTTGPHLHFEVRIQNNNFYATRNPELWLVPPQGWGILVGKIQNSNGSMLTGHEFNIKSMDTGIKWVAKSYGDFTVNSDDYYQENFVLSDLPAGAYEISTDYKKNVYTSAISIFPGAVTYFVYRGEKGFNVNSITPSPSQ